MIRYFLILLLLFFSGCNSSKNLKLLKLISPDGATVIDFQVEVVDSEASRQLGLMYRKELPQKEGMLFIFPNEEPRGFWMKNTFLELDMLFFDRNKNLVSIVKRATPLTETRRESKLPAQYVLEIIGGSADSLGIQPGFYFDLPQ